MIGSLLSIALNRNLIGESVYVRCARCGTVAGGLEDAPLRTSTDITVRKGQAIGQATTPPEWTCPACGRRGPLEVGEELANDTVLSCRRTFLCRYSWRVPATVAVVTCPRCHTRQPGPASPRSR